MAPKIRGVKIMNVLLCLDDYNGDYTRHAAVTILSLLETNKSHKIKIYILSSVLSQDNIDELKRLVSLYNQEIEFIINDSIVPLELKKVIINCRESIRGPWYRRFFPLFIQNIDRILYLDCDVLVIDDISSIYNMNMHGKAIGGSLDTWPFHCQDKLLDLEKYINSGVLLFDAKKYDVKKLNVDNMKEINKKYSKYFHGWDQDKANIIFKDDIFVYDKSMNYQIISRYINKGLSKAKIVHCLQKPYVTYPNVPSKLVRLYDYYLNLTKWKGYTKEKICHGYIKNICASIYLHIRFFCYNFLLMVLGEKFMKKLSYFRWKLYKKE